MWKYLAVVSLVITGCSSTNENDPAEVNTEENQEVETIYEPTYEYTEVEQESTIELEDNIAQQESYEPFYEYEEEQDLDLITEDDASLTFETGSSFDYEKIKTINELVDDFVEQGGVLRDYNSSESATIVNGLLSALGYITVDQGKVDSVVVRSFQRDHGLAVDGIVGRQTLAELFKQVSGSREINTPTIGKVDYSFLSIASRREPEIVETIIDSTLRSL
jgi:peptidoglycan hydrolase-like protein with peptidoglycan-binding domain